MFVKVIWQFFFSITTLTVIVQEMGGFFSFGSYKEKKLKSLSIESASSNLYFHLDKNIYSPEETIWFKAYLLNVKAGQAKVLYVRIVNEDEQVIYGAQFPIYDIRAHGSMTLSKSDNSVELHHQGAIFEPPKLLVDGNYTLYAYTDRMVALGDTNVFVQPIRISRMTGRRLEAAASVADTSMLYTGGQVQVKVDVTESGSFAEGVKGEYQLLAGGKELKYGRLTTNTFGEAFVNFTYPDLADHESLKVKLLFTKGNDYTELSLNLPHRGNPVTVNCFPEGGRPVPGGRVAVEVLDILGNPVQTALRVMDGDGTVASIATGAQGMAAVELPQAAGVRYTVKTLDGRGRTTFDVPPANRLGGFSLKLHQDSTGSRAMIRNHGKDSTALLVLRSNREILWSAPQEILPGDSVMVVVPVSKYPKDVLNLAVFGGDSTPQAERLFLNRTEEPYQVKITTDRQQYGTHQKVTVSFTATDSKGKPVVANFSVAATEKNRNDSRMFHSILHQWYYGAFAAFDRHRLISAGWENDLDRLLLGLRYQPWGTMHIPSNLPCMNTGGTTGTVVPMRYNVASRSFVRINRKIEKIDLRSFQGLKVENGKINPIFKTMSVVVNPDDNTFFVPDSVLFSRTGQEWELKIPTTSADFWDYEYLVEWKDPSLLFDDTFLKRRHFSASLNTSIVTDPITPTIDFGRINQLAEVLIGRKEKAFDRTLKKGDCNVYEEMLYGDLEMVSPGVSRALQLTTGQTQMWGHTPYGEPRTIIYLGCGRYRDINYIKNITIPEEFPLPDYEASPTTELDMRSTVYWNPNIFTDADGTATFSFFTSDVTGEFEIVAQGLVESTLRPLMGKGSFNVTMKQ